MPASRCTLRRSTAPTTITSPNPASRAWRGCCARRSRSIRARPAKCRRPKAASAGEEEDIMAVYTVHEPPLRRYDTAGDPDRFVFVRDGFSFWAFLLGPLWMLRHRMWLVLIGYLVLVGGLQVGLQRLGVEDAVPAVAGLLVALLIGFEAGTLRRLTLDLRRWTNIGVLVRD